MSKIPPPSEPSNWPTTSLRLSAEVLARDLWRSIKPKPASVDVHLVSFPKCGRTWLELMIGMALVRSVGMDINEGRRDLFNLTRDNNIRPTVYSSHDWSETTLETQRAVNPHFLFASDMRFKYWGRRVFLLTRDPRDTIVSSFHQVTKRAFEPLEFKSIDDYALDPLYGFNRLIQFYRIWDKNADKIQFSFESYENLRSNTNDVLRRCLIFMGVKGASTMQLEDIIDECSFENFRSKEQSGRSDLRSFDGGRALKARKGNVGGYTEELQAATIETLNEMMEQFPSRFGFVA